MENEGSIASCYNVNTVMGKVQSIIQQIQALPEDQQSSYDKLLYSSIVFHMVNYLKLAEIYTKEKEEQHDVKSGIIDSIKIEEANKIKNNVYDWSRFSERAKDRIRLRKLDRAYKDNQKPE